MITRLLAVSALALLVPLMAEAQTIGAKVPPYQPPAKAAPPVPDGAETPDAAPPRADQFQPREDVVARFRDSYAQGGRPRLAFWWNRQVSDTLAQWHSETRTVTADRTRNSTEGDLTLKQSGGRQSVTETQRRTGDPAERPSRGETWEWEFQDGFLGPFLQADAHVVDRAMITRIMGAGAEEIDPRTVEVMAMQTMADLMVEVLVADSAQSSTGYELRARILDVRTGRVLAMVNSRALKEWRKTDTAVATAKGFELPDEDDESFGPERAAQRYKATPSGFERTRRPPKLSAIAHNLATNVMTALLPRLEGGAVPVAKTDPATPAPVTPPPAAARPVPNDSAVPLPEVEAKPLPAPEKAARAEGEEPPMPKPTRE